VAFSIVILALAFLKYGSPAALTSIFNFKKMSTVPWKIHPSTTDVISEERMKAEIRRSLVEQVREKIEEFSFKEVMPEQSGFPAVETYSIGGVLGFKLKSTEPTKEKLVETLAEEVKREAILLLAKAEAPNESVRGVREKEKNRLRQILFEKIKQEIEVASVDQMSKEISPILVAKVKEEMLLDFAEGFKLKSLTLGENPLQSFNPIYLVHADGAQQWPGNENAVFRLFIWRDMLVELAKNKPILGFSFGKPLRSISLEILYWGYGDWYRDGWIGAHNSYLHMIYRTGIIGILLIFSLGAILLRMIIQFIRSKSFTGILLCAIIINWFTAANFLLIFELPYTAIPLWTIYGMTLAYYHSLMKGRHRVAVTN